MNLKWVALYSAVMIGSLTSCSRPAAPASAPDEINQAVVNELPNMVVTLLDGSHVDLHGLQEKTVIVVFRPECDHCQREATEIASRLPAFGSNKIFFITSDPMPAIEKFAQDYGLTGHHNVFLGWTSVENVLNNFGSIAVPSIYVYSQERKLVKFFNGEVDLDQVLQYI